MSFLNWPLERKAPEARIMRQRRSLILRLFEQFGRAFPEITYELIWESETFNAQAWRLGSARYVRAYGGLVRHPTLTRSGLAVMLAHEAGHHLGGLPWDPDMRWMTWQGQADYWAAGTAMPRVFGPRARRMTLQGAREFLELHRDFEAGWRTTSRIFPPSAARASCTRERSGTRCRRPPRPHSRIL
jgi:hypothetical protein